MLPSRALASLAVEDLSGSTTMHAWPRRMLLQAASTAGGGQSAGVVAAIVLGAIVGAIILAVCLFCVLAGLRRKTHGHCVRVRALKAQRAAEAAQLAAERDGEVTFEGAKVVSLAQWDKLNRETGLTAASHGLSTDSDKDSCHQPAHFKSKISSNSSGTLVEMPFVDWELDPSQLAICKKPAGDDWVLGNGAFGKVYKAVLNGVHTVAVKVVPNPAEDKEQLDFRKEVSILRSCHNANVVQFMGACMQPGGPLYLVTELMVGGSLWAMLHNKGGRLITWANGGKQVALDAARGLAYLHGRNIVHLDIKSANVLLTETGRGKIADVGISHVLNRTHISDVMSIGTWAYIAPELVMGIRMSVACDIYSFGIVLWEIVTGGTPKRAVRRECKVPSECPAEVADLIDRCCAQDPADRPTIKEIIETLEAAPPVLPQTSLSLTPSEVTNETVTNALIPTYNPRDSATNPSADSADPLAAALRKHAETVGQTLTPNPPEGSRQDSVGSVTSPGIAGATFGFRSASGDTDGTESAHTVAAFPSRHASGSSSGAIPEGIEGEAELNEQTLAAAIVAAKHAVDAADVDVDLEAPMPFGAAIPEAAAPAGHAAPAAPAGAGKFPTAGSISPQFAASVGTGTQAASSGFNPFVVDTGFSNAARPMHLTQGTFGPKIAAPIGGPHTMPSEVMHRQDVQPTIPVRVPGPAGTDPGMPRRSRNPFNRFDMAFWV